MSFAVTSSLRCSRKQKFSKMVLRFAHDAFYSVDETNETTRQELVHKEKWEWSLPHGHDTGIRVKNSYLSTPKLVPLIVNDPKHVTWYACGPTVYDSCHIGHASTYLQFDMIRRILTEYFGLGVCMVMGITNMDDKIINRALLYERGVMEIANMYEKEFYEDMKTLNILPPTIRIRVTEIIPQIIEFIQKMLEKNQAYITPRGNVYFEYNSAHQSVAKLCREFFESDIAVTEKKFEKDVCLWKCVKPGEPYWDAPWGKGRPGWHIECSVSASICFKNRVDIHSGGMDLRFPHHEYEIAQCDSYHGCHQWVNYFFHSGQVTASSGQKMSKSLRNFITINEFLEKAEDPDILRLICCLNKWNMSFQPFDYEEKASSLYHLILSLLGQCREIASGRKRAKVDNFRLYHATRKFENAVIMDFKQNFNIPSSFQKLESYVKLVERNIQFENEPSDVQGVVLAIHTIEKFLNNLGFTFHKRL